MIAESLRRVTQWRPPNVILFAIGWSILFALTFGLIAPRVRDGTGLPAHILGFIGLFAALFLYFSFLGGVLFLLRRNWKSALYYFVAACTLYASFAAEKALKGDRFAFTSAPHHEIAGIYTKRQFEFNSTHSISRLVDLDVQCHPPEGCACWLLIDPAQSSGVKKEIGRWHRPTTPIFPVDTLPVNFAIIDVKQIDSNAYSILGCSADWRGWLPFL